MTGRVVVMSEGRGSSSSATVLAEMIRIDTAPAAIVLGRRDPILVAGAVVAAELYGKVMPIVWLPGLDPREWQTSDRAIISPGGGVTRPG